MNVKTLGFAAALLPLLAAPALAHHSFAMFDATKMETKEGTVKEFEWTNPHVWLHIMGQTPDGKQAEWSFEMQATATAASGGWKSDSVRPGDKVTIEYHPLKDGSRGGELVAATLPDGRRLGSSATRPPPVKQ